MSSRSVVVWLVVAVIMGVAALLLLRSPPTAAPPPETLSTVAIGERILSFTPGDVLRLIIEPSSPDAPRQVLERATGGNAAPSPGGEAEWLLAIEPSLPGAFRPPPWPLESAQMQPLLRVLSETRAIAAPAPDAALGQRPIVIHMSMRESTITLLLAERTIAGSGLIEIESVQAGTSPAAAGPSRRRAIVDDKLHLVFTNPGPRAWRVRTPLSGIAQEASRITLDNSKQRLALARVDGRWTMRAPVSAPAAPGAVQRLIAQLARVTVEDFLDDGPGTGSTGLERPIATMVIEVDRRSLPPGATDPVITTETFSMTIGGPADASNARLHASVNDQRTVLLDARTLQPLSADATQYIWPHPIRVASGDVGQVDLASIDAPPQPPGPSDRSIRRAPNRWMRIMPDATEAALVDKDLSDADALVTFLTGGERSAFAPGPQTPGAPSSDASSPRVSFEPPPDSRKIGTITIRSLGGDALESIDVLALRDDAVALRSGPVFRTYALSLVPTLLRDFVASSRLPAPASAAP